MRFFRPYSTFCRTPGAQENRIASDERVRITLRDEPLANRVGGIGIEGLERFVRAFVRIFARILVHERLNDGGERHALQMPDAKRLIGAHDDVGLADEIAVDYRRACDGKLAEVGNLMSGLVVWPLAARPPEGRCAKTLLERVDVAARAGEVPEQVLDALLVKAQGEIGASGAANERVDNGGRLQGR